MTATLERRKEVLRLAREHDFLILEGMYPQHLEFTPWRASAILTFFALEFR